VKVTPLSAKSGHRTVGWLIDSFKPISQNPAEFTLFLHLADHVVGIVIH